MSFKSLGRTVLALVVGILLVAGSAQAMGKKAPVEKEKELGHGGTMEKSYDPETGVKRMEKTTGGEKTMTLEKEPHSGATVERSWSTGSPAQGASPGAGKAKGKSK